jgi:hypothetical protein
VRSGSDLNIVESDRLAREIGEGGGKSRSDRIRCRYHDLRRCDFNTYLPSLAANTAANISSHSLTCSSCMVLVVPPSLSLSRAFGRSGPPQAAVMGDHRVGVCPYGLTLVGCGRW